MSEIDLSVAYYGYVFDASGYGSAARAYIHALHGAGVRLSVVNLGNHQRQVRDALVESLAGRRVDADFHLFHGIPPQWSRRAFNLRNVIGMTVWETDSMPAQWRNILNHAIDVWLPCEFNVTAFRKSLEAPVFKLPHPRLPSCQNESAPEPNGFLNVQPADFVFYSIFEWQDRKSPHGMIEAYLNAFREDGPWVLVLKTNPGAREAGQRALEEARQKAGSPARIELRAESWPAGDIEALHRRGNCYVSLHRGEGWGYPLFEAASRGTPVIATRFSGPLEYLTSEAHHLVRYQSAPVHQPYIYYNPQMRWANPDCAHASELMRHVLENYPAAKNLAQLGASRIESAFSLDAIGHMAKSRLTELLQRTRPAKWKQLARVAGRDSMAPPAPIPGSWYDADYFDKGLKSNWREGYSWPSFGKLFQETAAFLTEIFPEAGSFMDAGCAKGFLVRALRERGKECWGVDHSSWAIRQAGKAAVDFIVEASIDDFEPGRKVDVLVVMSVLESLREDQIRQFLLRARTWTRTALFAVIAGADGELPAADQDLSHITMKPRRWWHEVFRETGWLQDGVHRMAQRFCQRHPLPTRMGWNVYLYSPGHQLEI